MSDHPQPEELGHGYGETLEQHQRHASIPPPNHWGLSPRPERALFYFFAFSSWVLEIAASVTGSYYSTHAKSFIPCATVFLFMSWAAWWQTVVGMMQRASWVRDESNLPDRRRYLYFAVRLQRLMLVCLLPLFLPQVRSSYRVCTDRCSQPTAFIAFVTFVVAYVRRTNTHDVGNWLLFLLVVRPEIIHQVYLLLC